MQNMCWMKLYTYCSNKFFFKTITIPSYAEKRHLLLKFRINVPLAFHNAGYINVIFVLHSAACFYLQAWHGCSRSQESPFLTERQIFKCHQRVLQRQRMVLNKQNFIPICFYEEKKIVSECSDMRLVWNGAYFYTGDNGIEETGPNVWSRSFLQSEWMDLLLVS